MKIIYCDKWWLSRSQPICQIGEEEARRRHESREPYVALLGGSEHPQYIVDIADSWVSVVFLDQNLRQYLRYDFKEKDHGRLFLKSAYYWEYAGDEETEQSCKTFSFYEDGHVLMEDRNEATGELRELETTSGIDENVEKYPEFGDYDYLCREDRRIMRTL